MKSIEPIGATRVRTEPESTGRQAEGWHTLTLAEQVGCAARTAIFRVWGRHLCHMTEAQLDRFDRELDHEIAQVMRSWRNPYPPLEKREAKG